MIFCRQVVSTLTCFLLAPPRNTNHANLLMFRHNRYPSFQTGRRQYTVTSRMYRGPDGQMRIVQRLVGSRMYRLLVLRGCVIDDCFYCLDLTLVFVNVLRPPRVVVEQNAARRRNEHDVETGTTSRARSGQLSRRNERATGERRVVVPRTAAVVLRATGSATVQL